MPPEALQVARRFFDRAQRYDQRHRPPIAWPNAYRDDPRSMTPIEPAEAVEGSEGAPLSFEEVAQLRANMVYHWPGTEASGRSSSHRPGSQATSGSSRSGGGQPSITGYASNTPVYYQGAAPAYAPATLSEEGRQYVRDINAIVEQSYGNEADAHRPEYLESASTTSLGRRHREGPYGRVPLTRLTEEQAQARAYFQSVRIRQIQENQQHNPVIPGGGWRGRRVPRRGSQASTESSL